MTKSIGPFHVSCFEIANEFSNSLIERSRLEDEPLKASELNRQRLAHEWSDDGGNHIAPPGPRGKVESILGFTFAPPADQRRWTQTRVVIFEAIEETQQRIMTAPFEFVADLAHLLQIAVRVEDENPCASGVEDVDA